MKYCKDCGVYFDTPLEKCIFCGNQLEDIEGTTSTYNYTPYKPKAKGQKIVYRLVNYINLIAFIVSLYIDLSMNKTLTWSLYVMTSNVYSSIVLTIIYYQPKWLFKLILITSVTIPFIIGIGLISNDYQWTLDYVFPLTLFFNQLLLTVLLIFNRKRWQEYLLFLLIISLIGFVPFILNLTNVTVVAWPGMISGFYSLAAWIGVFFLSSKKTKEELKRRFHI